MTDLTERVIDLERKLAILRSGVETIADTLEAQGQGTSDPYDEGMYKQRHRDAKMMRTLLERAK